MEIQHRVTIPLEGVDTPVSQLVSALSRIYDASMMTNGELPTVFTSNDSVIVTWTEAVP